MFQPKDVPELVHGLLDGPLQKKSFVLGERIEALTETSQRDDGKWPAELGLPENKVKTLRIKINIRYGKDFILFSRLDELGKPAQNQPRTILAPPRIERISGDSHGLESPDPTTKFPSQILFQNIQR